MSARASAGADGGQIPQGLSADMRQVGLSAQAAWLSGGALYFGGGVAVAAVYAAQPAHYPLGILALSVVAIAIGLFYALVGPRLPDRPYLTEIAAHASLSISLAIWLAGELLLGSTAIIFSLLPLFTAVAPCYLFRWRTALPYLLVACAIAGSGVAVSGGPAVAAHVLTIVLVYVGIAVGMMALRERMRMLAERNRRLAYTDPLTGLANTRTLRERIASQQGADGGRGAPFALFVMDLDNFKQVNDELGHGAGDRVLCSVASALRAVANSDDLIVRRGGDEFVVLAGAESTIHAEAMRRRLRTAIRRARLASAPEISPTATVAHVRTRPGEDIGSMLQRADAELHQMRLAEGGGEARRRIADGQPGETARRSTDGPGGAPASGQPPFGRSHAGRSNHRLAPARHASRRTLRCVEVRQFLYAVRTLEGPNPAWFFAGLAIACSGILLLLVALGGLLATLDLPTGIVAGLALLLIAALTLVAGGRDLDLRWLNLPWLAVLVLLAGTMSLAGRDGHAIYALLPGMAIYGIPFFSARIALLYAALCQGIFVLFEMHTGDSHALALSVTSCATVALLAVVLGRLRQITVRLVRRNVELSEVDALTGVANARALHQRLVTVAERARQRRPLPALIEVDLDEFKPVNDRYSHTMGDRVLVAVARAIRESLRAEEMVARRGGDEFVAVVQDEGPEHLLQIVARISHAIVGARQRLCPDLTATASIATVQWREGLTPGQALEELDMGLLRTRNAAKAVRQAAAAAAAGSPPAEPSGSHSG